MNRLKKYKEYINESISLDELLSDLEAKTINIFDKFKLNAEDIETIEDLYENDEFNEYLVDNDLNKSEILDSSDYQTLLTNDIEFILIHTKEQDSTLENPKYIIIQEKNRNKKPNAYHIKQNITKFFELIDKNNL